MTRRRSAILAIALSLGLVLGACGDDSSPSADGSDTTTEGGGDDGLTVTLTADAIDMPAEVTGGVVNVKLESDLEEAEVNFTSVTPGTAEDQFKETIAGVVTGGPIPEFILATTGVIAGGTGQDPESTLVLPAGDYIAWSIPEDPRDEDAEGGEGTQGGQEGAEGGSATTAAEAEEEGGEGGPGGGPPPEAILTRTFTVTSAEEGELPELDGNEIVARDYTFDVNVKAGASEFVFRNEGPAQFHHVVLFNFGDTEASVVEENLPKFLQGGEDAPPPPAFRDVDFEKLEAGDSTVLSPGLGATASAAEFESGSTYAAICFISDRKGGGPHAFEHGMRTVFTVE